MQTKGTIFRRLNCWMYTRMTVACFKEHPSLLWRWEAADYSPDNLITQWIKGAPTDEGFLSGLHVLLYLMNEPAAERPGDWEHRKRCSPPQNVDPCPFPSSFSMALTAAVVGKVFDSQANNFPLCTSLCRFFLLSLCLRWEQIAETKDLWRTCFSSSIHPPSTPLLCSFIYLESIEQNKSRCLVTALVSVGVLPEGKPVSMTRENHLRNTVNSSINDELGCRRGAELNDDFSPEAGQVGYNHN